MTHYGINRGNGLRVTCRNCDEPFDPLGQDYDTSLCPDCVEH